MSWFSDIIDKINPVNILVDTYDNIAGLWGGDKASRQQRSVNENNKAIAQMNNEYNMAMLDKQLDYNKEMWNLENDYNNPTAQAARLKAAGLNPALFMGQGNATGTAGSHLGINPAPASEAGRQQIGNTPSGGNTLDKMSDIHNAEINQTVGSSQAAKNVAETNGINIENKYKAANAIADIAVKASQTKDNSTRAELNQITYDLKKMTFSDDVKRAALENDNIESQTAVNNANSTYIGLMAQLKQKELEYFDQNALANLSLIASQIVKNHADADLARQMIKTEVEKAANLNADTRGKRLNNRIIERTTAALVRSAYAAASSATSKSRSDKAQAIVDEETIPFRVREKRFNTGPKTLFQYPEYLRENEYYYPR